MATGSTTWLSNTHRLKSALRFVFALAFVSALVACGGSGGGSSSSSGSNEAPPTPALSLLAGNVGGFGNVDGTGSEARFNYPNGVAVDSAGNSYVADSNNHTIRKITAAGVVTTLAGTAGTRGSADGTGSAASFYNPKGVAVDGSGNVYVADYGNHAIRMITAAGVVTTLAGSASAMGNTDGIGAAARFLLPTGIAVDNAGSVYVADDYNYTIRKINAAGVVTTLAGTARNWGSTDGIGSAARFKNPAGIAVDNAGSVYVADMGNQTIRKIDAAGVVTTLAGTVGTRGSTDGTGSMASFDNPVGIAVDSSGTLYVANRYAIRKITANGTVSTLRTSTSSIGSTGASANIQYPSGIAVDSSGKLYVADSHTIRTISPAGDVTTLAGTAPISGMQNGTGEMARLSNPCSVAVDGSGNVYVADYFNSAIRKITPNGLTSTFADTSSISDGINYGNSCMGNVAVDGSGNVYATTWNNHSIHKITPTGAITTLAGTAGDFGNTDGTGAAARFWHPGDIAVDGLGNVYVADRYNNTIRKITPTGDVSTLAGSPGDDGSTDGTGATARFGYPVGIAVDRAGNIYVGDSGNHTIRKITPTGMVTTLAGSPGNPGSADGVGTTAHFNSPNGVAVDGSGNVYVADSGNHTIRKITPAGVVTTVVGQAGVAGFVPGALPGLLTAPKGVAIGGNSLYITMSNAIVRVSNVP